MDTPQKKVITSIITVNLRDRKRQCTDQLQPYE
ncbi:MAG: hypothetical protein ACJAXJ_000858 [Colwellia sp.]|jgi:hypothetical protein